MVPPNLFGTYGVPKKPRFDLHELRKAPAQRLILIPVYKWELTRTHWKNTCNPCCTPKLVYEHYKMEFNHVYDNAPKEHGCLRPSQKYLQGGGNSIYGGINMIPIQKKKEPSKNQESHLDIWTHAPHFLSKHLMRAGATFLTGKCLHLHARQAFIWSGIGEKQFKCMIALFMFLTCSAHKPKPFTPSAIICFHKLDGFEWTKRFGQNALDRNTLGRNALDQESSGQRMLWTNDALDKRTHGRHRRSFPRGR